MEEQLFQVTEDTWAIVLGLAIRPHSFGAGDGADEARFTGRVDIRGAWEGRLYIRCSESMIRRAAAIMYATPTGKLVARQCQDALGELANIIGGNVKALLPGDTELTAPVVTDDPSAWELPDTGQVTQVEVDCEGSLVHVAFCTP